MNVLQEIKIILNKHHCECYTIDIKKQKIIYVGTGLCDTLHPAIAEITGFLLLHNIDYEMTKNNDITLHLNKNSYFTLNTNF